MLRPTFFLSFPLNSVFVQSNDKKKKAFVKKKM